MAIPMGRRANRNAPDSPWNALSSGSVNSATEGFVIQRVHDPHGALCDAATRLNEDRKSPRSAQQSHARSG
jgi:hypothetical protein